MRLKGTAVLPHSLVLAAPKEDRFEKTVRGLKDISLEVAKAKPVYDRPDQAIRN